MNTPKKPYQPMTVAALGSLTSLTQANMMNSFDDAAGMNEGMGPEG